MSFLKDKLDLPLLTPPSPPPHRGWCESFMYLALIIFMIGTSILLLGLSLYPPTPSVHLLSANLRLGEAAANFSGRWDITFQINLPPNTTHHDLSVTNLTASLYSRVDHNLLAETLLPAPSLTEAGTGTSTAEQAMLVYSSAAPPYEGWSDDRDRGFLVFDLQFTMKIRFKLAAFGRVLDYKVRFEELKFEFAGEGDKEGGVTVFPEGRCTDFNTELLLALSRCIMIN